MGDQDRQDHPDSLDVAVHLLHQSQPVVRTGVRNTYVKSGLFCLMQADGSVEKYPIQHIFRVVES